MARGKDDEFSRVNKDAYQDLPTPSMGLIGKGINMMWVDANFRTEYTPKRRATKDMSTAHLPTNDVLILGPAQYLV
jgi:hypothetical protein